MPPPNGPEPAKTLEQVVEGLGRYPLEAFQFVQEGLNHAVKMFHGSAEAGAARNSKHVSGQQLCEGLREYALLLWGRLARTVLLRWDITSTHDFGEMVFAMIESGMLNKTDEDEIEDFRDVYDFKTAFEADYRIPEVQSQAIAKGSP